MYKYFSLALLTILLLFTFTTESDSCTNLLVSKGASADGSVMITYLADAGGFMEPLVYMPAKKWEPNDSLDVYDWDTGKYLGRIKQAAETYLVIGNINEHQVAIGETTFTGHRELRDTNGIMDYGSLKRIALQRAKTAREAIKVITDLVTEYGYYSTGESFSIADKNEAWIFEMIGKAGKEKGAVWVARRVPEGYVAAHANQARIREFPLNDPENCLYSPDVISFAEKMGYYDPRRDGAFSFVDAYNPLDPGGLLYCEGRVWSIFNRCAPSLKLSPDYFRAVIDAEPYPLFIKPDKKLTVRDVQNLMRDHFNGTDYDMTKGLAAEPYGNPYRWKPLGWKVEGDTTTQYGWERPISTQQTAFSFVAQLRSWLPNEIGGIFWYGVDDTYSTVYIPIYCNNTDVPEMFKGSSIADFSLESGFWIFNLVANHAYLMYKYMIEDIKIVQDRLESKFEVFQPAVEKTAQELYKTNPELAVEYLTDYTNSQGAIVHKDWTDLWKYLTVKYNDGFINDVNVDRGRRPKSAHYPDEFLRKVLRERPNYYKIEFRDKDALDK